ncbi:hypothetical protein D3C71_1515570 [compost metagenome]
MALVLLFLLLFMAARARKYRELMKVSLSRHSMDGKQLVCTKTRLISIVTLI